MRLAQNGGLGDKGLRGTRGVQVRRMNESGGGACVKKKIKKKLESQRETEREREKNK
jgi:hypothetical protein